MMQKRWKCLDCGKEFSTQWIPFTMVRCPSCGSKRIYRVDARRGRGYGVRARRGICGKTGYKGIL